ncbi:unnamed protein product, partial [Allacma fusca]
MSNNLCYLQLENFHGPSRFQPDLQPQFHFHVLYGNLRFHIDPGSISIPVGWRIPQSTYR